MKIQRQGKWTTYAYKTYGHIFADLKFPKSGGLKKAINDHSL